MTNTNRNDRLVSLPVQIVETSEGVILRRGVREFRIPGKAAVSIVHTLFTAFSHGKDPTEVLEDFSVPNRPAVASLIEKLREWSLLTPGTESPASLGQPESHLEIFCWNFGRTAQLISEHLNRKRVAVLGVNQLSRRLIESFMASGMKEVRPIDVPLLRNLRMFDQSGRLRDEEWPVTLQEPLAFEEWEPGISDWNCVVATSDFGATEVLRDINTVCVERNVHFFPVMLDKLIGYIGPMVVPGETACFECLRLRRNSNSDERRHSWSDEDLGFEGQIAVGFHPTMASITGDLAAFELIKFYAASLPGWQVGTMIEVNLLVTELKKRRILKIPNCAVCSPLVRKSSTNLIRKAFNDLETMSL
jgi:thiazole/oxazole-forming peptide maturase SagC family component